MASITLPIVVTAYQILTYWDQVGNYSTSVNVVTAYQILTYWDKWLTVHKETLIVVTAYQILTYWDYFEFGGDQGDLGRNGLSNPYLLGPFVGLQYLVRCRRNGLSNPYLLGLPF